MIFIFTSVFEGCVYYLISRYVATMCFVFYQYLINNTMKKGCANMEIINTNIKIEEVGPGDPACWAGCVAGCAASTGFGTLGSVLVAGGLL